MVDSRFEERVLSKLDSLEEKQNETNVHLAKLPQIFVPRSEFQALRREATAARRWAIGAAISVVAIIAPVLYSFAF